MGLDLFTINRSFYIGSRYTFKTALGGILSLIFTAFIIPVSYYLSYDFLYSTNPIVQKYAVNVADEWNRPQIPLMLTFPKEYLNKTFLLELNIEETEYYKLSNLTECKDEEVAFMIGTPRDESLTYYCNSYNNIQHYEFKLIDCKYKDEFDYLDVKTCNGEIGQPLTDYSIHIGLGKFDKSKRIDSITKDVHVAKYREGYNMIFFQFSFNKLENDLGVFFKDVYSDFFYSYYDMTFFFNNDPGYVYHSTIVFIFDRNYIVEKSYMKLQTHLMSLFAILRILFLIFNFVNWNDFFYCRYFLNLHLARNPNLFRKKYLNELKNKKISNFTLILEFTNKDQVPDIKLFEREIQSIYTFKNYILSNIPIKTQTKERFQVITEIIKNYISIDNVVDNFSTINQVDYLPNERPSIVGSIFAKLDTYAGERNLYLNGDQNLTTKSGFFLSIIYYILWIPVFLIFGYDFLTKREPTVSRYDRYNMDILERPENASVNMPLMLEVSTSFAEANTLLKFNTTDIAYDKFNYHKCTEEEYYKFNKTEPMSESLTYYCTDINEVISDTYLYTGQQANFISFLNCTIAEQLNLADEHCNAQKSLLPDESIYFAANYIYKYFNGEFENFIETKFGYLNNTSTYTLNQRFFFDIEFAPLTLNDDSHPVFTTNEVYNIFEPIAAANRNEDFGRSNHIEIGVSFVSAGIMVNRTFQKLPETMAKAFAILDVVFVVCFLINIIFSTHFFHTYFNDYFFKHLDVDALEEKIKQNIQKYHGTGKNIEMKITGVEKETENVPTVTEGNQEDKKEKLNEYKELFTFSNYLKLKLFYCCCYKKKEMIKFNCLYKEFKKYLYIENISTFSKVKLTKKNTMHQKGIVESFMKKTDNILKEFDLLTYKQVFYLNTGAVFKTKIGGILNCIYLSTIIIFFYFFGYEFFARANPDLLFSTTNYNDLTNSSDYWKINIPTVLEYSKDLGEYTRLMNMIPLDHKDPSYGLRQCTSNDLKLSNIEANETLTYVCTNVRDLIVDPFQTQEQAYLDVATLACSETGDETCTTDPDPNQQYYVGLKLNATRLNYTSVNDFLIPEYYYQNKTSSYYNLFLKRFIVNQEIFIDDKGLVLNEEKEHLYTSVKENTLANAGKGFDFQMYLNRNIILTIKRTFKKFPETLAKVLAMLSFVNLAMSITYGLIIDFLYMKYFLKKMFSKIDINSLVNKINHKLKKTDESKLNI
jgi:hypothetical protein